MFSQFDRLILLSSGKCVYADELDQIPSFYANVGRSLPEKHRIPTDMLKAASNWTENEHAWSNGRSTELVDTCGKRILQEIKKRHKPSVVMQFQTVFFR